MSIVLEHHGTLRASFFKACALRPKLKFVRETLFLSARVYVFDTLQLQSLILFRHQQTFDGT